MEYADSYSQFLARLDSDAENILSGSDSQASLSPLDGHSSSTSLSPDPLRFTYDEQILGNGLDANFQIFNPDQIPVFNDQWDQLMQNDLPSSTVASPINIKAEQSPYSSNQSNNNYNSKSTHPHTSFIITSFFHHQRVTASLTCLPSQVHPQINLFKVIWLSTARMTTASTLTIPSLGPGRTMVSLLKVLIAGDNLHQT